MKFTEKNIRYGITFKAASSVIDDSHLPDDRCLFCNGTERNYEPPSDTKFICGSCLQLLLRVDNQDLKRGYAKALNFGYLRKARAIETFLTEVIYNEQRKPKSKKCGRYSNRTGIVKSVRNQKERIKRVPV